MGKLLVVCVGVAVWAAALLAVGVSAQSKYTVRAKTMHTAKLVTNLLPARDADEEGLPVDATEAELVDELPRPKPAVSAAKAAAKAERAAKKAARLAKKAAKAAKKAEALAKQAKGSAKKAKKAKKAKSDKKAFKKADKLEKKVAKLKAQPGAASAAAGKAVAKAAAAAPRDQVIRWIKENSPGASELELHKLHNYLKGQMIYTFEDVLAKGVEGVNALFVGEKWRAEFRDLIINHLGKTRGFDNGEIVTSPPLIKGFDLKNPPKKTCKHGDLRQPVPPPAGAPRFASVPVNPTSASPVGDWLRRAFPDVKPLRMSRTILALERQTIRTFDDLRRVGEAGVKRLLYVPNGIRAALYEAILYHVGTEGHDDGKPVTARHYLPPPPVVHTCN